MKTKLSINWILIVALAMFVTPALAHGEDEPSPGVARVSLINGDVTTQRGDSGDWVATTVNAPVVLGDRIATGDASRTEVQLDYANVMRLDQRSEAKLADLTRSRIQVQLAQGTLSFAVFKDSQADAEIDTPNVAVQPIGEGEFRIQVNSPAETLVIVRRGEAQVSTPQGSTLVKNGEIITVEGEDNPEYKIAKAPPRDQWDEWNSDRDNVILNAQSYRHTNRYYTGSQDLDRYGQWVYVPGHDWCWTPYVNLGWVPYRSGRWIWEPYWGWTWVSYEPWGWAPYHYGRWFVYGSSWYWWPGYVTPAYYPVWAPAYVSFIGFGYGRYNFGFGFGYGFSSIGWLPLGPYDRVYGWWGHHRSYNVVNITNITNVTNVTNVRGRAGASNFQGALTNSRVRAGITSVSTQDFVSGRMPRRFDAVNATALRQGRVVEGTLPVVPTRQSLSPANRTAAVPAVARSSAGRNNFFTRNQPPAGPERFSERATQIRQMVEQPRSLETAGRANAGNRAGANAAANRTAATAGRANAATGIESRAANQVNNRTAGAGRTGAAANSNTPAAVRQETAQPSRRAMPVEGNSSWQRFGGREPAKDSRQVSTNTGQAAAANSRSARPAQAQSKSQAAPAARTQAAPNAGWNRFESGSARPSTAPKQTGAPQQRTAPSTSDAPQRQAPRSSSSQAAPAARTQAAPNAGWKRFDSGSARPAAPRQTAAPRQGTAPATKAAPQQQAPNNVAPRSAPAARNQSSSRSGNWKPFTPQARPATQSAPATRETARPGWSRFPSGSESRAAPSNSGSSNRSWSQPAPRASSPSASRVYRSSPSRTQRPPLEIRKPIVVQRSQRSYQAPRSQTRSPSRSTSSPRSQTRSGNSGNRGGGRSAPSKPSGNGNRHRH